MKLRLKSYPLYSSRHSERFMVHATKSNSSSSSAYDFVIVCGAGAATFRALNSAVTGWIYLLFDKEARIQHSMKLISSKAPVAGGPYASTKNDPFSNFFMRINWISRTEYRDRINKTLWG